MRIKQELDLSLVKASEKHVPLFNQIRDDGHVIEDDFYLIENYKGRKTLIIDVGSNIGAFSLAALQLAGSVDVIAFEPNISLKWFQDETTKTFADSGRKYDCHMVGLGDTSGTTTLYIPRVQNWYVIGESSMDIETFKNPVVQSRINGYSDGQGFELDAATVRVERFDDFVGSIRGSYEYLFLKMDIENFEPAALRGMSEMLTVNRPVALIENSKEETIAIMRKHGYLTFKYNRETNVLDYEDKPSGSNVIFVHPEHTPPFLNLRRGTSTTVPAPINVGPAPVGLSQLVQSRQDIYYRYLDRLVPALKSYESGFVGFEPPPQSDLDNYYNSTYAQNAATWYNYEADHSRHKVEHRSGMIEEAAAKFGFGKSDVFHEFGCAFGGTVAELARKGYIVSGSELNNIAVDDARERGVDSIFAEPASEVIRNSGRRANVVYGFHVLEHFANPNAFLQEMLDCLQERSIVFLAVPNGLSIDPLLFGYTTYPWFSYPGHLHMWTAGSSAVLAGQTGYEVLHVSTNRVSVRGADAPNAVGFDTRSEVASFLWDDAVKRRFLGEELVMIFTPKSSTMAAEYKEDIALLRRNLEAQRRWELEIGKVIEAGALLPLR